MIRGWACVAVAGGCLWAIIISLVMFIFYLVVVVSYPARDWGRPIIIVSCLKCLVIGRVFYVGIASAGVFLLAMLVFWGFDKANKQEKKG